MDIAYAARSRFLRLAKRPSGKVAPSWQPAKRSTWRLVKAGTPAGLS
jgi:hypothetical protein